MIAYYYYNINKEVGCGEKRTNLSNLIGPMNKIVEKVNFYVKRV